MNLSSKKLTWEKKIEAEKSVLTDQIKCLLLTEQKLREEISMLQVETHENRTSYSRELTMLQDQLNRYRNQEDDLNSQILVLQTKKADIEKELTVLLQHLKQHQEELRHRLTELESTKDLLSQQEGLCTELATAKQRLLDELEHSKADSTLLRQELNQVQDCLARTQQECQGKIRLQVEQEIAFAEAKIKQHESNFIAVQASYQALKMDYENLLQDRQAAESLKAEMIKLREEYQKYQIESDNRVLALKKSHKIKEEKKVHKAEAVLLQQQRSLESEIQQLKQERADMMKYSHRPVIDMSDVTIQEEIGVGGDGKVSRGIWFGTPVAVKEIPQARDILDEFKANAELDIPIKLRAPHILPVFGCGVQASSNSLFILMELKDFSLDRMIGCPEMRSLFTPLSRLYILQQILSGIWSLHKRRVIHGDLKPENVLLDEFSPGRVRVFLADFGRSLVLQQTLKLRTQGSGAGQMATVGYAAPESTELLVLQSDIYSFAIIAWELLADQRAWSDITGGAFGIVASVLQDKRPNLLLPEIASIPGMADFLQKCWAKHYQERPTVEEAHIALRSIISTVQQNLDCNSPAAAVAAPIIPPAPPAPPLPKSASSKPVQFILKLRKQIQSVVLRPGIPLPNRTLSLEETIMSRLVEKVHSIRKANIENGLDDSDQIWED